MKTRSLFAVALLAAGVALGISGCAQQPVLGGAHVPAARPAKTFALAVTLPDGSQPTPAQWAAVKAAFEQQLAAAGATLTDNLSLADKIIRVVFTPAEDDPSNGNAMVLSVRDNPAYAFNARPSLMPVAYTSSLGFGYSSAFPSAYNYNSYYGYNDYYDYGSGGGTVVTPRVEPPNHHRPTQPADCPPGQERPNRGGDHFTGGPNGSWNRDGNEHGGTWTRSSDGSQRTWTRVDADGTTHTWTRGDSNSGGRTWTRAEPYPTNGGNSGNGRTWTRSEPSYSSSNSSSGSSSPSSSYSNNASSSSSYSSSSSSSSSYSGGSSTSASDFSSSSSSSPGSFSSGSNSSTRDSGGNQAER